MLTITELKENADQIRPEIEALRKDMKKFFTSKQYYNMLNVRIWHDGSLMIHATGTIPSEHLKEFIDEYGLYHKAHFIKNEGPLSSTYELVHWEE